MSSHAGHGGNPGKFEPCRRFEVGFHNTFLVHPGTKIAARTRVNMENPTPKYAFSSRVAPDEFQPGLAIYVSICTCTDRVELSPGLVSCRDEILHVNIPSVTHVHGHSVTALLGAPNMKALALRLRSSARL